MRPGVGHIQKNLHWDAAVTIFRSLCTSPYPFAFRFRPLHPLPVFRPAAIESDVDPVVFGTRRERAHPNVVSPRLRKIDSIAKDRHLARIFAEVLSVGSSYPGGFALCRAADAGNVLCWPASTRTECLAPMFWARRRPQSLATLLTSSARTIYAGRPSSGSQSVPPRRRFCLFANQRERWVPFFGPSIPSHVAFLRAVRRFRLGQGPHTVCTVPVCSGPPYRGLNQRTEYGPRWFCKSSRVLPPLKRYVQYT